MGKYGKEFWPICLQTLITKCLLPQLVAEAAVCWQLVAAILDSTLSIKTGPFVSVLSLFLRCTVTNSQLQELTPILENQVLLQTEAWVSSKRPGHVVDQLSAMLCTKLGELPAIPEGNARSLTMMEIADKFGPSRGVASSTAHGVSKH